MIIRFQIKCKEHVSNHNGRVFIQENAFENATLNMVAILEGECFKLTQLQL